MSGEKPTNMAPSGDLEHLVSVLSERWVLTLATRDADGSSYATPLYFALLRPTSSPVARHPPLALAFASSPRSTHGRHLGTGPTHVAGAVAWETEAVGSLRGVQLRGMVWRDDALSSGVAAQLRAGYLARHAVAAAVLARGDAHLYLLRVSWAKLTDNRLGMGIHPEFEFDDSGSVETPFG